MTTMPVSSPRSRGEDQGEGLSLPVLLMLAPDLPSPRRRVNQDKCSFHIAGAGRRKEPMLDFWRALPECHKRRLGGNWKRNRKPRTYITPEALALWRQWDGAS